jgi:Holliday junction resolvase RusA-like endonuclease
MTDRFNLFVPGRPVPQGSKTAFVNKKTGRPVVVDKDTRLPAWRMKITAAAIEAQAEQMHTKQLDFPFIGPVGARITFLLARPKADYGTGRNASIVKASALSHPATMPDLDKLLRAVFDGLTDAGVWRDDAQVVWCQTAKYYVGDQDSREGVMIDVGAIH